MQEPIGDREDGPAVSAGDLAPQLHDARGQPVVTRAAIVLTIREADPGQRFTDLLRRPIQPQCRVRDSREAAVASGRVAGAGGLFVSRSGLCRQVLERVIECLVDLVPRPARFAEVEDAVHIPTDRLHSGERRDLEDRRDEIRPRPRCIGGRGYLRARVGIDDQHAAGDR